MVAPGTTAPVGSFTVPAMSPVVSVCATAPRASANKHPIRFIERVFVSECSNISNSFIGPTSHSPQQFVVQNVTNSYERGYTNQRRSGSTIFRIWNLSISRLCSASLRGCGVYAVPQRNWVRTAKTGPAGAAFGGVVECPSGIGFEWQNGSQAPRHNGRMNRLISYRKNGEQGRARFGVLPVGRQPNARYPDHGHIAASLV